MNTTMHWSRWGDPARAEPLAAPLRELVRNFLGVSGEDSPQVALSELELPESRLPEDFAAAVSELLGDENVSRDAESRIRHTRGKSTFDLLKMRSGDVLDAPDAVVSPGTHDEIVRLLELCTSHQVAAVPFGGGTSVVGGLSAHGTHGVIALDLQKLDGLLDLDIQSQTATLQAGLTGPAAEALVGDHGFTIGHSPQSFEYATIGGFAAARSSGQASAGYGRFDSMVVGMTVATPIGSLELGSAPSNAAGPDLRQVVLGSEGAFGIITSVRIRVRPLPETKVYEAWKFDSFSEGSAAMRDIVQGGPVPTILRLSDETETLINLADPSKVGADGASGCLLIVGYEDSDDRVTSVRAAATRTLKDCGGTSLGEDAGEHWNRGRYDGPYLRDSLLDAGVLAETIETATFWSNMTTVYDDVRTALNGSLNACETPPIVLCHISHIYPTGASLYFTVVAKQTDDPLGQWADAKSAASTALRASGATITHHHGIGRDHLPWFAEEIGPVGVEILRAIKDRLDPGGILNPGVLVP